LTPHFSRVYPIIEVQSLINNHAHEISELCRKFGVVRLELFGSAARGDFNPVSSDIDLIASFARRSEPGYADRYLDFAESLEALFGRKVDLLTPGAIRNPRFAETIKRESILIYESKSDQAA
jgi:predicted nucleotidyltransferase